MSLTLNEIRAAIAGISDDLRFQAWQELYYSDTPEFQAEIERILTRADPPLCILFLRFLASIEQLRAARYMVELMSTENDTLFHAATRAFKKNRFDKKFDALLSALNSPARRVWIFAVDQLGLSGQIRYVPDLLKLLKTDDEELLVCVLQSLRMIPDRRSFEALEGFDTHENIEIRRAAVHVLCALYNQRVIFFSRPLLRHLRDLDAEIRRIVIWSLGRRFRKRHIRLFIRLSLTDPDDMVRQECVIACRDLPTRPIIAHLLHLSTHDMSQVVVLRAEASLLSMDTELLLYGLKSCLKHPDNKIRHKAILMMSQFSKNHERQARIVIRELARHSDLRERIVYLQALGYLPHPLARKALLDSLSGPLVEAYVSMTSLYRILTPLDQSDAAQWLADELTHPLLRQILVRYFINKIDSDRIDLESIQVAGRLLFNPNINLRYYAALLLRHTARQESLALVLRGLGPQQDESVARVLRTCMIKIIENDFTSALSSIVLLEDVSILAARLAEVLSFAELSVTVVRGMILSMLSQPKFWSEEACAESLSQMILRAIQEGALSLADILQSIYTVPHACEILAALATVGREMNVVFRDPSVTPALLRSTAPQGDGSLKYFAEVVALSATPATTDYLSEMAVSYPGSEVRQVFVKSLKRVLEA